MKPERKTVIAQLVKGVTVETEGSVDHFHSHIRIQRGRKPQ